MTPKSTMFAAAIVAAALAVPAGVAQAVPIAPTQPAVGKTSATLVADWHGYRGRNYHHAYRPYRYHRRSVYGRRVPSYYGAYAYQPETYEGSYSYQPPRQNWYRYSSPCPYYGSNNLWWCH